MFPIVIQAEVQHDPLSVSPPSQASTSVRRRTATTSVTLRIPLWWRRLSAMKGKYDGQHSVTPPAHPKARLQSLPQPL